MMRTLVLIVRTFYLELICDWRYPIDALVSLAITTTVATTIFRTANLFGATVLVENLTALLMNWLLLEVIHGGVQYLERRGQQVEEAHLFPTPLEVQLFVAAMAGVLKTSASAGVMYITIIWFVDAPTDGLGTMLKLIVPLMAAAFGIAYILCGFQLLLKRVRSVSSLFSMLFFGGVFLPVHWIERLSPYLPFARALIALRGGSIHMAHYWLTSLIYLAIGYLFFRQSRKISVRTGLAGLR